MKAKTVFALILLLTAVARASLGSGLLPDERASDDLQLFSSIDRSVAAVGESIMMTVEVLASPRSELERRALLRAFDALVPEIPTDDIVLVRSYAATEQDSRVSLTASDDEKFDLDVVQLRKRFVMRPQSDGLIEIPGISIVFRGNEYRTDLHELHVYRLEGSFLKAQRAVLPLVVESRMPGRQLRRFLGTGSAFLIAEDALVTAYHVVVNAQRITAMLPDGRRVRIKKVWSIDPRRDVAILYINPKDVRRARVEPLEMAPRRSLVQLRKHSETDRVVFTTGWPDGIQQSGAGILFRTDQIYDDDAIWLSSNRVRPGDSGGPLIDRKGRVVGVVSYAMSAGPQGSPLLESVATATDPRPAIKRRLFVGKTKGLGAFRDRDFFDQHPQARAVKVMSLLTDFAHLRRRTDPETLDRFLHELESAVAAGTEMTRLHFLRGSIYQMLGDFDAASDAYQRALFERRAHYPAAYSLAYCRLALRNYEAAADLFDFTSEFEPYRDLAGYGMAQAKLQLLKYDEATETLLRIIHVHGDFAPALYLLGRAYLGKGDVAAAARILVKLRAQNARWGELLDRSMRLIPFRPVVRGVVSRAKVRSLETETIGN